MSTGPKHICILASLCDQRCLRHQREHLPADVRRSDRRDLVCGSVHQSVWPSVERGMKVLTLGVVVWRDLNDVRTDDLET